MILFSKRLTPTPSLALHLKITIQSQKPQLSNELIPVHSPLLRESYLVSYPPLTYMLKFSGFANLTSCLECCECGRSHRTRQKRKRAKPHARRRAANKLSHESALSKLAVGIEPCPSNTSRAPEARVLRRKRSQAACPARGDSCWNNKA